MERQMKSARLFAAPLEASDSTNSTISFWDALATRSEGPQEVVGVDDGVRVALFGEKALAVGGVLGIEGVATDDGVEMRLPAVVLGPQHPAEPLCLLLTGAEGAAHLDRDGRLGQVDREVRDL